MKNYKQYTTEEKMAYYAKQLKFHTVQAGICQARLSFEIFKKTNTIPEIQKDLRENLDTLIALVNSLDQPVEE